MNTGERLDLDLELDAERLEISSERLVLSRGRGITLLESKRQAPGAGISDVQVYSGGAPRTYHLLSSRLATAQAVTKVPEDTRARRLVVKAADEMVAALRALFVMDPVPAQMRDYVRLDAPPNRSGSTVSALVYALRGGPNSWLRLMQLVQALVESDVQEITFSEGRLPDERLVDVMVSLRERAGDKEFTAPARVMSDGTLRYLAIVASLLFLRRPRKLVGTPGRTTLVVEEIENGLFPSQGARVLDLLREEAHVSNITLLATTHSPALLDALKPTDHRGVVICDRSEDGFSTLRRLTDHPRYVEIAGGGSVGQAATRGLLEVPRREVKSLAELFSA